MSLLIGVFLILTTSLHIPAVEAPSFTWQQTTPLPDARGVAGAFAGVSSGALLVAGGANFPDQPPWEGGKKVWQDTVYVLENPDGQWRKAGQLPHPLGYGVSVDYQDTVVCVGGSDAQRHYADTFRLRWHRGRLMVDGLRPLPIALANMSGTRIGRRLYIAGGTEAPGEQQASNRFFVLDLGQSHPRWRELEAVPGPPRFLATAGAYRGKFYLFGGISLKYNTQGNLTRTYLHDAWCYRPGRGWIRLADLPRPNAAAPAPAPVIGGHLFLLAGDDGSQAGFSPIAQHPGFDQSVLGFDPRRNTWRESGELPAPRVTVPCISWRGGIIIPSGEVRPGVRSAEVWSLKAR